MLTKQRPTGCRKSINTSLHQTQSDSNLLTSIFHDWLVGHDSVSAAAY
ncbi:hypothetical protein BAUR920_03456 [Brevibacterium aurantiacum]|uniref:Uncharacterized protein n=1 Tax=Brevibacterium aurantiacum TaxID=273384 RepID=A0A2H1KQA5_BREAU|nr:hypothetical protein BAUR920_03456 [Brevibacterium aurantiacum]